MKFGSLFAGIGGFDLGLERAGMKCSWQVEKDEYCRKVLEKHWPNVKRYGDIYDVKKPEPVDVICGGFPCQPFSLAGKRGGENDDRYLWPEMLRIIQEVQPAWVIGENVPGIINMELDNVLAELENENYACQTFIIPACAVDAPHRRDRVWIVANSMRSRCGERRPGRPADAGTGSAITRRPVQTVANTSRHMQHRGRGAGQTGRNEYTNGSKKITANPVRIHDDNRRSGTSERSQQQAPRIQNGEFWQPEPGVGRVADGVSGRVDRLRALGNAVVPQVVEVIGKIIVEYDHKQCMNDEIKTA